MHTVPQGITQASPEPPEHTLTYDQLMEAATALRMAHRFGQSVGLRVTVSSIHGVPRHLYARIPAEEVTFNTSTWKVLDGINFFPGERP